MIEIKCTKAEQENLLSRLQMSDDCLFVEDMTVSCGVDTGISCDECLRKNIRWVITDEKKNQGLYSLKCIYCGHESQNSSDHLVHFLSCNRRTR